MKNWRKKITSGAIALILGAIAHSVSLRELKRAQERSAPLTPEIWQALLQSRNYSPASRYSGALEANDLPQAEVWAWPRAQRIQIGDQIFEKQHSRIPPNEEPLRLGVGWEALSSWSQWKSANEPPENPGSATQKRIWY